jgi:hypothetical protein
MKLSKVFNLLLLTSCISTQAINATNISPSSTRITEEPLSPRLIVVTTSSQEDIEPIVEWEKNKMPTNV